MRLFIGIPITEEIRRYVQTRRQELETCQPDFKWVSSENLHITLQFLGNVSQERLENLSSLIKEAALATPCFTTRTDRLGVFPSLSAPRVLWLGFGQGGSEISELAEQLKTRLQGQYHVESRSFHAHLTLARIRTQANWKKARLKLFEQTRPQALPHIEMTITHLNLYASEPHSEGSRYKVLAHVPLQQSTLCNSHSKN